MKSESKINAALVKSITKQYKDELKGLSNIMRKFSYDIVTEWLNKGCKGNFELIDILQGNKGYYFASFCLKQLKFNGFTFAEKLISEKRYYEFLTTLFLLENNETTIKAYQSYNKELKKGVWAEATQLGKSNLMKLWDEVQKAEDKERERKAKAAAKAAAKATAKVK